MNCKPFISLLMIIIYLLLPMGSFAQTIHHDGQDHQIEMKSASTADLPPCSECPCSDNQHTGCDSNCYCCSAYAPLPPLFPFRYSPPLLSVTSTEPFTALPQVYLPIFVPPQQRS